MTSETWAVHSLHSKAVQFVDGGYQVYPGAPIIRLGSPITGGESFDSEYEAEKWRMGKMKAFNRGILDRVSPIGGAA